MSTALAPPPVSGPRSRPGGVAARRAIRRWAWRLLRREWRQQLLVLTLLIVATASTTVGLGLVVNVQRTDQGTLGTADTRIEITGPGADGVARDLAAARQRYGTVQAITHESVPVPGSVTPVDLRDQDPGGVYSKPMLHLLSGHYPTGADQAAVTAVVATTFSLELGSTWTVDGQPLRVVGTVENPKNLQDAFGLVAPGQIRAPSGVTLLLKTGGGAAISFRAPAGVVQGIETSGSVPAQQRRDQALAVLLLATIGLTFIGLLSVAGFTVMAQRRLRALGMIGAIGATDRQVRRVMLANGTAVGIVGATSGAVVGLVVWFALTPGFEDAVGHRYDPLALPWWAVVAGALLAVLTSIAASWWPARAAARLPIVVALSGRPAPPQPARRFALLGTVLAAAGFVSLVFSHTVHSVLIVTGVLELTAGMLLLAPLGISALAAAAGRAPVAVRLALRDLARYQARSGSALAAATLAIGIAATITLTAAAEQAHDKGLTGGNLPANQLIVWLDNPNSHAGSGGVAVARLTPKGGTTAGVLPDSAVVASARGTADAIAQAVGSKTVVEMDGAVDASTPMPQGAQADADQATLVRRIPVSGGQGWNQVATPYVATPTVLRLYGIPLNDIAAGSQVLSSRGNLDGAQIGTGFSGAFQTVTVQQLSQLPNYTSAPNTLITPAAMKTHGYVAVPVGWLVQSPHALTSAQIVEARGRAAAHGITIETRTGPDHGLRDLRDYATVAGTLVALAVLAMTVGLIRSETARDLRTLTAAGASGATRRTLNATAAGALAALGGILGTASAYLALIAWHWHHINYLNRPPYINLAVLVLGLPVVAFAGAWLLGRAPKALGHRSLE